MDSGQYAFDFTSSYDTRDWRLLATYREIGDEFNPEVGFLPRRDYRHIMGVILRAYRFPEVEWFREMRPHIVWQQFWDLEGFTETYFVHMDSHFEFSNGAFFQLPSINFTGEGLKEPFEISEGIIIPPGFYENIDWGFLDVESLERGAEWKSFRRCCMIPDKPKGISKLSFWDQNRRVNRINDLPIFCNNAATGREIGISRLFRQKAGRPVN